MWKVVKKSLLQLFYPSYCLHCRDFISPIDLILCPTCTALLEFIDIDERCPVCFEIHPNQTAHSCTHCQKVISHFYRSAATFEYIGPAASLIKKLKYTNQPYLAKSIAAFLVVQLIQLDWPFPDALVPVPISFSRWIDRGYNQSLLIAQEMSHFLKVPVWDILSRKSGDFSQAALSLEQRQLLKTNSFKIHKKFPIQNKTLLLIDDVITTGTTLNKCAECLIEEMPAALYSLTFCKTLIK